MERPSVDSYENLLKRTRERESYKDIKVIDFVERTATLDECIRYVKQQPILQTLLIKLS